MEPSHVWAIQFHQAGEPFFFTPGFRAVVGYQLQQSKKNRNGLMGTGRLVYFQGPGILKSVAEFTRTIPLCGIPGHPDVDSG
jgi:hypothetical protein